VDHKLRPDEESVYVIKKLKRRILQMPDKIVIRYSGNDRSRSTVRFLGEHETSDSQLLVVGDETKIIFTGSNFSEEKYHELKGDEHEKRLLSR
jgi:hypothetical protein